MERYYLGSDTDSSVALRLALTIRSLAILFSEDISASLRFRITGASTRLITLCHLRFRRIYRVDAVLRLLRSCRDMERVTQL
jgi:hypothetical protein